MQGLNPAAPFIRLFVCVLCVLISTESTVDTPRALFSDLDGTLLHYPKHFTKHNVEVLAEDETGHVGLVRRDGQMRTCRLFPSSTMGQGYMSFRYFLVRLDQRFVFLDCPANL